MNQNVVDGKTNRVRGRGRVNGRVGVPILLLGICLLLLNLSGVGLQNWWALFVLLPALLFFGVGWTASRHGAGAAARGSFGVGLIIFTVFGLLIFDMNWSTWWPMMVLMPGLALFGTSLPPATDNENILGLAGMGRWLGGTAVLLGLTFLAGQFGLIDLQTLTRTFNWWGLFILIPAVGAFWQATRSLLRGGPSVATTWLSMLGTLILVPGVQELFDISWQGWEALVGTTFILSGAILLLIGMRRSYE